MKTCTACATTQPYPRAGRRLAGVSASRSSSNGGTPVVTALTETASGSFSGDGTSATFRVNVGGSASDPTTTLTETNTTDLNGLTVTTDDIDSLDNALVTAIASADNSSAPLYSASWTYNSAGDLLSETLTDSDGNTTAWTFNSAGQLTSRTLAYGTPEAATTAFGYDANGNLISVTDPDGNVTTYTYNAQGQETSMTDPLGNTQTMAYNAQGQLIEQTNRDGLSETYAYNDAGQMVQENWYAADGTLTDQLNFSYNTAGQLVSASNDEGTYTFTYNAQGQVIGVTEPFGLSLTFAYDSNGNRVEVQDSLGGTTQSSYDAANQLVSELFTETGQPTLLIEQSYNADGTVASQTYYSDASGTNVVATTAYGYDSYGDVTSIVQTSGSGTVLGDYTYSYDTSGDYLPTLTIPSSTPSGTAALLAAFLEPPQDGASVVSETDNGVTTDYSYDASNQLVGYGSTTQSYDLNGNRNGPGYVVGAGNQLLSDGTYNYTYDADGNEASKTDIATGDQWVYGYNNADQLISAVETTSGGVVETQVVLQYDVFGNRLQEQVWTPSAGWTTTRYAYDAWDPATPSGVGNENWKVWATLDGNNNLETRYINGDALDQVFAQIGAGGAAAWYLTDRLGSTRLLVDNNGDVLNAIGYNAWGEITSQTNPSLQPIVMFAGAAYDPALGLYLNGNGEREYDPQTGRFIEQDPTQLRAGDSNFYRYVGNDPTNATDPSGLFGYEWPWSPNASWSFQGSIFYDTIDYSLEPVRMAADLGRAAGAGINNAVGGTPYTPQFNSRLARNAPSPTDAEANLEYLKQAELEHARDSFIGLGMYGVARGGIKVVRKALGRGGAGKNIKAPKNAKLFGMREWEVAPGQQAKVTKTIQQLEAEYAKNPQGLKPIVLEADHPQGALGYIDPKSGQIYIYSGERFGSAARAEELFHYQQLKARGLLGKTEAEIGPKVIQEMEVEVETMLRNAGFQPRR